MNIVCLTKHEGALIMHTNGHTFTAYLADSTPSDRSVFELGFLSLADLITASLIGDERRILRACVKADAVVVMHGSEARRLVEEFPLLKIANIFSFADEIAVDIANRINARLSNPYALVDALSAEYHVENTPQGYCAMLGTIMEQDISYDVLTRLREETVSIATVKGRTYDDKEALKDAGFIWCAEGKCWTRVVLGHDEADTIAQWLQEYFCGADVIYEVKAATRKDVWK